MADNDARILELRLLSSLDKVFADAELEAGRWGQGSMLCNEVYSFQIAYRGKQLMNNDKRLRVRVVSELAPWISLRKVELIPSELPCYSDHDDNVLRTTPGLYPDLLMPFCMEDGFEVLPGQWRAIWASIDIQSKIEPGIYPIEFVFETLNGVELDKEIFHLKVIGSKLPKQTLVHTEWLHTDCVATWYGIEVFSDDYWKRVGQFIKTAVKHGVNMILTPVFTPPLDTKVGGERPTVQLVDVEKSGNNYKFRFDNLERWIDVCHSNGVEYFEFSHLFTQWGALHAPKIMARENGTVKKIFGWDTDAAGEDYKNFLDQFLPELVRFIKANGLEKFSYFHVSDEPFLEHQESYRNASNIIKKHLGAFPVIDALSDYEFYQKGLVRNPIPATDHIEPFLENNVPNLWTYYCCGQYKKVSNRFFNVPSSRTRIIGMQLYKYNIVGFLHWGFNFWNSQYSRFPIDPFRVTDAGYAFPSGDAFVVYPSKEGPLASLRLEVFYEALQDLRALKLLEKKVGREAVLELIEEGLDKPLTFSEYPTDAGWLLNKREEINRRIET